MLDEKKIEEAAQAYCDATYGTLHTDPFIAEGFRQGAQWAIDQFLKDLWHDKTEIPCFKEDGSRPIIAELCKGYGKYKFSMYFYVRRPDWRYKVFKDYITRWLYIDNLLPKQKGDEE